jgi:spermidine synthase
VAEQSETYPDIPMIPEWPDTLLLAGFLISGMAALGLELIWIRILGLAFGSESFGMLGVLAGFFAGLALGAASLHRVILRQRRPVLIYIAVEGIIAFYALTGPVFLLPLAETLPRWLGPLVGDNRSLAALSLNLLIAMLVLLPATFCMGVTTAALIEAWRRRRTRAENDNTVAWLYAVNTLGATAGILLTMYLLLPALGIAAASAILGAFGVLAAALVFLWDRAQPRHAVQEAKAPRPPAKGNPEILKPSHPLLYGLLFFTGLAGIGIETVGTHILAQIFDNTVHTFANILAIYLLGTAAGAGLYAMPRIRRLLGNRDHGNRERDTALLLFGLALASFAAAVALAEAAAIMSAIAPTGSSYIQHMLAETTVAGLVFLLPTVLMGATYSHLLGHFTYDGAGYACALNTLGASIAPFLFGLLLIPSAGYGVAFFCAAGIYLALFAAAGLWSSQPLGWMAGGVAVAAIVGFATFSPLVLIQIPSNTRLVAQRVGLFGVVSVTESLSFTSPGVVPERILRVDQRFLMGGTPGFVTKRMGQTPVLLSPTPRQVLYLGTGTGITAGAALDYPVEHLTAVELLPEILDMLPWFKEFNHDLEHDPRVELHASDARRFIRATPDTYDVIVADLYHPSRDGTASLYTQEHYRNIRGRLKDDGLFVQWLPLYQLRPEDLKTIMRTFLAVFPRTHSMIGNYSGDARFALLGWAREGGPGIDVARAEALLGRLQGSNRVFDGVRDLLASSMLDQEGLRQYAGPGPLNTDGNQRIAFDAARGASILDSAGMVESLATLLPYRRPFPEIAAAVQEDVQEDVRPYAEAVGDYLAAEIARLKAAPGSSPTEAVAQYLKAYELDVRFTLPIGKLLELSLQNSLDIKETVNRLWQTHPEQPEVRLLHQRLEAAQSPQSVRAIVSRFLQTGGQ